MIQINDSLVHELLSNPALKKSDTRTVIFLLQNPGALSSEELAAGIGVSKKSANKSVNRLIAAKVIQPGAFQDKRRTLNIPAREIIEPSAATEESNKVRFDRLEAMIGTLMDTKGAGFDPAPLPGGQELPGEVSFLSCEKNMEPESGTKGTVAMPVCSPDDELKNTQAGKVPENGQKVTADEPLFILQDKKNTEQGTKGTTTTEQGTNEPENDSIVSVSDPSNTRARLAALKAASFNQEKQKQQPGARTSIDDEFHALFGVQLPAGSDPAAVGVMISRKKAGKLDVKSPLAYLNSLSGKVTPILATPPPPALPSVTDNRLSHADMARIDSMWNAMDHSQYKEKALAKDQTGKKYPVPVELLARSIFNAEMMAQGGIQ